MENKILFLSPLAFNLDLDNLDHLDFV